MKKITHRFINGSLYVYKGKAVFKNLIAAIHDNGSEEFKSEDCKREALEYIKTFGK